MICAQPPLDICGIVKACPSSPRGDGNCNCNCLREKRVRQGRGRRGIERWVCFFMLSYVVIVFLAYPFQCRSTDLLSRSSQLLDGLLLQDLSPVIQIWSSHFCLAIMVWRGASNCYIFNRRPAEHCCSQIWHGVVKQEDTYSYVISTGTRKLELPTL